jgi:acetyl esterase
MAACRRTKGVGITATQIVLEPVTQQFVDAMATGPALQTLSPAAARAVLTRLQSAPVGRPRVRIEDIILPVGPTGSVAIRTVRPRGTTEALPVIMHFHGGGWTLGDAATHDRLMRELAVGAGATLVFVAYARSPEATYPLAIEQAYAATKYVAENARALNVDATRLAVLGDGAGGNIAAAVTLLAKQRRGPKIDLQILFTPITDAGLDTESYRAFGNGPWLSRAAMAWFWDGYLPDAARRSEITASPLGATIDQLRHLPDALVIVAENDVLRDEGEAYARKLSDAGVRTTSVRYLGTVHDFVVLNALADTPAARAAIAQAICALKAVFG